MGEDRAEPSGAAHPDESDIVAFASGELDARDRATIDEHLDGCPSCRGAVAALLAADEDDTLESPGRTVRESDVVTRDVASEGDLPALSTVGRYVVKRVIGRGGMGVIYEAEDPELGRRVALKVLRDAVAPGAAERLLREAKALAQLEHPNVVGVFDTGSAGGRVFLAMALVEGGTLRTWWVDPGRTRADVLRAMLDAGRGLAAAHDRGLVHRDFKPENVLVHARGDDGDGDPPRFVVTDFGLVAPADRDAPRPGGSLFHADITKPGALLGTPAYMALEQIRGHHADPRADQFAFAVTLFEGLVGRRPFAGKNVPELAGAVMRGALDWTNPRFEVGAELEEVITKALAAKRDDRHESLAPVLQTLRTQLRRA